MMVLTRTDDDKLLSHVLENIITMVKPNEVYYPIHPYLKFHGIDKFSLLFMWDDADCLLPYRVYPAGHKKGSDQEPPDLHLKTALGKVLRNVLRYLKWLSSEGTDLNDAKNVKALDHLSFQEFNVNVAPLLGTITPTTSSSSGNPAGLVKNNAYSDFLKSIKKDKYQCEKLLKDEQMDVWHRTFTSTAISHECGDVLDPKYQPKKDHDSQKLWKAKQILCFLSLTMFSKQTRVRT